MEPGKWPKQILSYAPKVDEAWKKKKKFWHETVTDP